MKNSKALWLLALTTLVACNAKTNADSTAASSTLDKEGAREESATKTTTAASPPQAAATTIPPQDFGVAAASAAPRPAMVAPAKPMMRAPAAGDPLVNLDGLADNTPTTGSNAKHAGPAGAGGANRGAYAPHEAMPLGQGAQDNRKGAVATPPPPPIQGQAIVNVPPRDQVAPAPVLDRNARYATTYRPGGAALAAFDAAVSKGSIPTTYKDLVGDFGGRYAPNLPVPQGAAMAFQVDGDRAMLSPSGGLVNLRIAMKSSDVMPQRAPLSVHLVLDISGSMQGVAIENAKQAAETLVKKLEAQDDFSMTTFSDDAEVLVEDGPAVARRDRIVDAIHKIQANGGTNISSGLDMGYKLAHSRNINPDAVKVVLFLSDGHANAGDTNPITIAQRSSTAFQDGIQTSSFGLGADYDAQIMSSVADQGAGGYYYLADSSQISPALTRELDARLVPVAQAVEVRLRLRPEITPRKVFGSRVLDKQEAALVRAQEVAVDTQVAKRDNIKRDRQTDAEGGMRFFMPAFARDDSHAMLVTIEVPEGVGETTIGSIEIKYKDRIAKKNITQEIPIRTKYATSDAESAASTNQSVAATVQAFAAGDAILKSADSIDSGNRAYAATLLHERAELLQRASSMLDEPRLGEEAQRLARLSLAVNGDQKIGDPLPLALMLRGSGYGYLR